MEHVLLKKSTKYFYKKTFSIKDISRTFQNRIFHYADCIRNPKNSAQKNRKMKREFSVSLKTLNRFPKIPKKPFYKKFHREQNLKTAANIGRKKQQFATVQKLFLISGIQKYKIRLSVAFKKNFHPAMLHAHVVRK